MNKKVLVLGGNGYVGRKVVEVLSKVPNVKVTSLSRSLMPESMRLFGVDYVQGDCMKPENFGKIIEQSDSIVHSIGVLVDSVTLRKAKEGEKGSYEQMNFLTAKNVGDYANKIDNKKRKFIYLSANQAPPLLPRYLKTKKQTEQYMSNLDKIDFYSVRSGLVVDQEKFWTLPMGKIVDINNSIVQFGKSNLDYKLVNCLWNLLDIDRSINRRDLAEAIAYIAITDRNLNHLNNNNDIKNLSISFKSMINEHQLIFKNDF